MKSYFLNKQNQAFHDYFVGNKEHLKFTMISLNDDSNAINIEAFHLLLIILQAPKGVRGSRVNDTLNKNWDKLIEFISNFNEDKQDDESLEQQKQLAIEWLSMIQQERDSQN